MTNCILRDYLPLLQLEREIIEDGIEIDIIEGQNQLIELETLSAVKSPVY
jgi:hypothetical protein